MLRILDLCSGTQSVKKVASLYFGEFDYTSLDWDPKTEPSICCDLLKWQPPAPKSFDVIWFSPQCTAYSTMQKCHRNRPSSDNMAERLREADKLVLRGVEIIRYLRPRWTIIENPWTGLLKDRGLIPEEYRLHKVSYCKYGYPYKKDTAIWTDMLDWQPLECRRDCWAWLPHLKHHRGWIGDSRKSHELHAQRDDRTIMSVPPRLISSLLEGVLYQHRRSSWPAS